MSTEFNFLVIDANQIVEKQQGLVRDLVAQRVDLEKFQRAERPPSRPAANNLPKRFKREVPVE